MRRIGIALAVVVAGGAFVWAVEDSKYTNKQVMKLAHGGGQNSLLKKVAGGKATTADKAKLVELYESMAKNKPKKGDAEGFAKMAETLLEAAKAVQNGEKDGAQKLAKASNCMACHNLYK